MAGKVGTACKMIIQDLSFTAGEELTVSIVAVDAAGNRSAAFKRTVKLSAAKDMVEITTALKPYAPSTALPVVGGLKVGVIDVMDKIDPVKGTIIPQHPEGYRGGNHLFSAADKKIRLFAAKNEYVWFQLVLGGQAKDIKISTTFGDGVTAELFESAYVGSDAGNMQDPLMPINGMVSIPSTVGKVQVAGQKYHTVLCEVFVPHAAKAGSSKNSISIRW